MSETNSPTIFTDFLSAAGVKHTYWYSARQFRDMPFRTYFGLSKLLQSYGIESVGLNLGDKSAVDRLPLPFIAQTPDGSVIVTRISDGKVTYLSRGRREEAELGRLTEAMSGNVLVAYPSADACEPDYASHHFTEIADRAKKWVLIAACAALFAYLFLSNRLYSHVSTVLLTLINLCGVYISTLLIQKSAHIKNRHADAVCSVVEAGGCDDVLSTDASKFFGIFGWSEVGFAYFSVSLLCLLIFPQYINLLALCNLICLPFSFWSVWYQKFRAHAWCTLCLCVQSMLWLLFFCYLFGGWLHGLLPLRPQLFVLGVSYLAVMLGMNALMPLLDRQNVSQP